jgi:hypothetical protein
MTQELPNLVDERRFRRPREAEPVERDHLGRVIDFLSFFFHNILNFGRGNGLKKKFQLTSNSFLVSTFVPRWWVIKVSTSNTFNKKPIARSKSRVAALALSNMTLAKRVMSPCTCMYRTYSSQKVATDVLTVLQRIHSREGRKSQRPLPQSLGICQAAVQRIQRERTHSRIPWS